MPFQSGATALHVAAGNVHATALEMLLAARARVDIIAHTDGKTAFGEDSLVGGQRVGAHGCGEGA